MADNIAHGGLVIGADVPDWRARDLKSLTVRQTYGGAVQVEKVGGNPPFPATLMCRWSGSPTTCPPSGCICRRDRW